MQIISPPYSLGAPSQVLRANAMFWSLPTLPAQRHAFPDLLPLIPAQSSGIRPGISLTRRRPPGYTSPCTSGSSSVVECFLAKEDVAGSTPVSRSSIDLVQSRHVAPAETSSWFRVRRHTWHDLEARYPSGKGEVCKTFMRRFDPDPRLQILANICSAHALKRT